MIGFYQAHQGSGLSNTPQSTTLEMFTCQEFFWSVEIRTQAGAPGMSQMKMRQLACHEYFILTFCEQIRLHPALALV